jgi:hypothetical protein
MPDDPKQLGALLIAASLVAAIRLRGEPVKPSPRLTAGVAGGTGQEIGSELTRP